VPGVGDAPPSGSSCRLALFLWFCRVSAAALAALLVVGPATEASGVVSTSASVRVGRQAESAGCAQRDRTTVLKAGENVITDGGTTYQYLLAVPPRLRRTRAAPLVVEFQGFGSTAPAMADLTQLPERGAARGFVVVTPEGPNHTWQLNGRGSDADYVEAVLSRVEAALCIDLHRVYAAGFSQGAAFTILFACAHPGQMAAIATVAVEFRLGCATPIPLMAFHGTSDPAVPYANGAEGISLPGVKVRGTLLNMGDWATLDGCRSIPIERKIGPDVVRRVWPSCARGDQVVLYTVLGGGHTWPGAARSASPMYTTETISATNLTLAFFADHRSTLTPTNHRA
jgi:polyhydroxybutyrate depolymerase